MTSASTPSAALDLGFLTLPNRMLMGSMHTRLETLDHPARRLPVSTQSVPKAGVAPDRHRWLRAPTEEGSAASPGTLFNHASQIAEHRPVTEAVHAHGARIALQILHAGRYAKVAGRRRAAPRIASPINPKRAAAG